MKSFKQLIFVLSAFLLGVIIWVGSTIYLNYSSVELKGEYVGLNVDIEYSLHNY